MQTVEVERDIDMERRSELRAFLVRSRSRLHPGDVGLPDTKRRRVPGLRRGEVAELIGVTVDWYRWFEVRPPGAFVAAVRLAFDRRFEVERP